MAGTFSEYCLMGMPMSCTPIVPGNSEGPAVALEGIMVCQAIVRGALGCPSPFRYGAARPGCGSQGC